MAGLLNVDVTKVDATAKYNPGALYRPKGESDQEEFMYVKHNAGSNAVTVVAGFLAYFLGAGTSTPGMYEVTADYASATTYVTLTDLPAGFYQSVPGDGEFCWLQTKGPNRVAMLSANDIAQGSLIQPDTSANGQVKAYASGVVVVASAKAADVGTVQAIGTALINIPTI